MLLCSLPRVGEERPLCLERTGWLIHNTPVVHRFFSQLFLSWVMPLVAANCFHNFFLVTLANLQHWIGKGSQQRNLSKHFWRRKDGFRSPKQFPLGFFPLAHCKQSLKSGFYEYKNVDLLIWMFIFVIFCSRYN